MSSVKENKKPDFTARIISVLILVAQN